MPATPATPVFLNFDKDIQKAKLGNAEVLYVPNKDNSLFRLRYRYNIGTLNDNTLGLAAQYVQFLGTNTQTAEQITKAFYKIACSFNVSTGENYTTVTIEGLQENFEAAVKLYEDVMANMQPNESALQAMKARIAKSRKDTKANKGAILQALTSYATYGANNKFNNTYSNATLEALTAQQLIDKIKNVTQCAQTILYYGPQPLTALTVSLKKLHPVPATTLMPAPAKTFVRTEQNSNQVLFTDYDMVQAETRWVRNLERFDPNQKTIIAAFNNYFGGGMSSLVFQTIRESKALAYSTYGYCVEPQKAEDHYQMLAYVGSQADKFEEAVVAMNALLTTMPELSDNLELAKTQIKKDIQTERITQDGILYTYLNAKELGVSQDLRQQVYNQVDQITMKDIKAYHDAHLAHKPYTYVILGSEKRLSPETLSKLGQFKKLSLEELFGY